MTCDCGCGYSEPLIEEEWTASYWLLDQACLRFCMDAPPEQVSVMCDIRDRWGVMEEEQFANIAKGSGLTPADIRKRVVEAENGLNIPHDEAMRLVRESLTGGGLVWEDVDYA